MLHMTRYIDGLPQRTSQTAAYLLPAHRRFPTRCTYRKYHTWINTIQHNEALHRHDLVLQILIWQNFHIVLGHRRVIVRLQREVAWIDQFKISLRSPLPVLPCITHQSSHSVITNALCQPRRQIPVATSVLRWPEGGGEPCVIPSTYGTAFRGVSVLINTDTRAARLLVWLTSLAAT